jgi:hypothetical protein
MQPVTAGVRWDEVGQNILASESQRPDVVRFPAPAFVDAQPTQEALAIGGIEHPHQIAR